jgi:20S proteasome subunit beta 1
MNAAIAHAMARDGSSGGVIRLITIDKEGVTREFIPGKERVEYKYGAF